MAHVELSRASEVHRKKPLDLTRTTRSWFLPSFALPDKAVQLQTHDTTTPQHNLIKQHSPQSTAQHSTAQHSTTHATQGQEKRRKEDDREERSGQTWLPL